MAEDVDLPEWETWLGELDAEALSGALGRERARDPEHPLWRDARFLEWLARQMGAPRAPVTALEADALEREGRAMLERIARPRSPE